MLILHEEHQGLRAVTCIHTLVHTHTYIHTHRCVWLPEPAVKLQQKITFLSGAKSAIMVCLLLPRMFSDFLKAYTHTAEAETPYPCNNQAFLACLVIARFLTLATGPRDLLPGIRRDSLMPSSSLCTGKQF